MGGSSSIYMGIRLNQETYVAGDTVQGTVYCQCSKETPVSCIRVELQGKETTYLEWQEEVGSGDSKHLERRSARDQQVFLKISLPVFSPANGLLPPGQYEFPFQVQLPSDLSSSLTFLHEGRSQHNVSREPGRGYDKQSFEIGYKAGVFLVAPHGDWKQVFELKNPSKKDTLMCKTDLRVLALPKNVERIPSHFVEPDTQNVNACCCINRGFVCLGAKSDPVLLQPGQVFSAQVAFKNQSTVNLESLEVVVKQHVKIKAQGKKGEVKTEVGEVRVPGEKLGAVTAKLQKKQSAKSRDLVATALLQDIYQQLQSGQCPRLDVHLNPYALQTYKGNLVEIFHKAHWSTRSPPRPIFIIPGSTSTTPTTQPNLLQPPPGWNPSIQPLVLDNTLSASHTTASSSAPSQQQQAGGDEWSLEGLVKALSMSGDGKETTN
eukprot:Cvel_17944.t1-p1 / transcript=Cvel_17944.t1 / gene=Cvel_17944 / organism=Chromera_velia_CCMP2878 / gene_product=Arrestin domain-containing protein A, putative / transcript_product=Arrestin domain-containing protein A, putative / location=Cvel_scaffold1459:141-1509(-) / protein_length=432 / sequence_SO=supercontig / SO=protein_coding / is_pseudo=false